MIKKTNELINRINSSIAFFDKINIDEVNNTIEIAKENLKLSESINYKKGEMKCLYIMGTSFYLKGEVENAINYFNKSLDIADKIDNTQFRLKCYNSLGNTYFEIRNYVLSIEYYNKVIRIAEESKYKDFKAKALNNIGEIYNKLESYEEALEYYIKCKKITEEIDDKVGLGIAYLNIGDVYYHFRDYEKSEFHTRKGLKILEEINYRYGQAEACQLLGKNYFKLNKNDKALEYFNKSLDLNDEISNKLYRIDILVDIYKVHFHNKDYNKSIQILKEALELSKELKALNRISKICSLLANIYELKNNKFEALKYYKLFHDIEKEEAIIRKQQILNSIKIHMKMEQANLEKEKYRLKNIELKEYNELLEELYNKIKIISEIGQRITSTLDLDEIIKIVYENVDKLMDSDIFGLGQYDRYNQIIAYDLIIENGERLTPYYKSNDSKFSFAAICIKNKEAIMINDIKSYLGDEYDEFVKNTENGRNKKEMPKSLIYCPLIIENDVIGMITVQSFKKDAYSKHNLDTIKVLASYIAIAINNANKSYELSQEINDRKLIQIDLEKANKKLLEQAHIDPLTKLLNRRRFIEVLNNEWNHCRRKSENISLIMIDVDKFKEYNDNYGHLSGDTVLISIADTIKKTLKRTTDYIARYGGDEFIVILPLTDSIGAKHVAERILESIRKLRIEHKYSSIDDIVTLTLGISTMIPTMDTRIEELIHEADEALYVAKAKGRNRVEVYNTRQ